MSIDSQIDGVRAELFGTPEWMRAPNGEASLLPEMNWLQVRTPGFMAWSGDWLESPATTSCILDRNGEPLLVHRGESSGTLFEDFDLRKTRAGVGFFFAEDVVQARGYAGRGTDPRSFYLSSNKKLDLLDPYRPALREFLAEYGETFDEWIDRYSGEAIDPATLIESGSLYDYEGTGSGTRWNALFSLARAQGYDAVTVLDVTDGVQAPIWVVFSPEQIRIADGNMRRFEAEWGSACRTLRKCRA